MRCFALIGPAGAGKSTLMERLSGLENGPAASHSQPHGVTALTAFNFMDEAWCGIDCRGGAEALPATRQALLAADIAVLCVTPDPEQAVLAAPYFRLTHEAHVPTILFINKMDESHARVREIVAALQDYSADAIVLRQIPIREGEDVVGSVDLISERAWRYREGKGSALIEIPDGTIDREREARSEMLEKLSEFDDWLLEEVVEDREPAAGPLYAICTRTLRETKMTPALIGAAEKSAGMMRLMKALRHEAPPVAALRERLALETDGTPEGDMLAVLFQCEQRKHVGKVTYMRALAGDQVVAGSKLAGTNLGGIIDVGTEKKHEGALDEGAVAAAIKADPLVAGTVATREAALPTPDWSKSPRPMMARLVMPKSDREDAKLSAALARMAEADPALMVEHEKGTGSLLLRVAGASHLREVIRSLDEDYGVLAEDAPTHSDFRETITRPASVHYRHRKQTGGAGQFADVKLTVEPVARGDGFHFGETVKGGAVPRNHIPAVEAGARDALVRGPNGFEVIDVAVTLTDGKHHAVDSSDFAFRAAGKAGVLEALGDAVPVVLQPIQTVTFQVPSIHSGALVPLVASHKGRVLGFEADADAKGWDVLRALLPAESIEGLAQDLRGATQGTGHFVAEFAHFEEMYGADAERAVSSRSASAATA
ncbi:MAG: elongation factor G [Pseudomonadota bacterium]